MLHQKNSKSKLLQKFSGWILAGSIVSSPSIAGADLGTPTDISSRFLFVAHGFDNNDQVQATLDGYLPNACYKIIEPRVEFTHWNRTYLITAMANKFEGDDTVCGQYEVPFTVTANLGQILEGDYTVAAFGTDKKALHIKPSSTLGPDDYLYAPVDHSHVRVDVSRKEILASIEGRFTNSCMRFKEVKVLDQKESIVVLPIINLEERDDCHAQDMRYKPIEVKIPWRQPGRYLMHVRGLSGASINQVFEVDAM